MMEKEQPKIEEYIHGHWNYTENNHDCQSWRSIIELKNKIMTAFLFV